MLEGLLVNVNRNQIGDGANCVSSEDRNEESQLDVFTSTTLYDRANALWTRFEESGQSGDLEEAILLHRKALDLRPASHPERSTSLDTLASALWTRFDDSGRQEDLEEAILLHRQALELRPPSHPDRSMSLDNLALALSTRFSVSSQPEDLEEAIVLHREALELLPTSHPDRSTSLDTLATALSTLFEQSGRHDDLEEAILLQREALELLPASHPDLSIHLRNLALTLNTRFRQSGQTKDLDEAILLHQQALELQPASHPDRYMSLNNLALALESRSGQSGRPEDLAEVILLHREALELQPVSHPDRSMSLTNLAFSLWTRFCLSGQHKDLEEAILLHREALELVLASHPRRYMCLDRLASALCSRFKQSGRNEDLEEAILLHHEALELLPASHIDRPTCLTNFASTLWRQFGQSGRCEELEMAITLLRQALELRPASHPNRSMLLNNLATALWTRFRQLGEPKDMEEVILFHRQAGELQPASHPDQSMFLDNLALALWTRFRQLGQYEDLEEAILLHRRALPLRPPNHPDHSVCLNGLATALWTRFTELGRHEDMEEAISLHRAAVEQRPSSHPDRSMFLNNLALALGTKFDQLGRPEDLEESILLHRETLELRPASHPDRSMSLNNLANALSTRFDDFGQHEDLEEAIDMSYQCLALVKGHPSTCLYSRNQGNIYFIAYSHTNESKYLQKAMESFRVAVTCETAPTSLRFRAAKQWASIAEFRHESALDAYHAAIQLLPRLAMLGLDLSSRQQALTSGSDGLARAAAACAIRAGHFDKAVELLEEGRAVFWSQALQLRTPMTDLRDVAPELEERLRSISLALEQGSLRDISRSLSDDTSRVISMEQEAAHFRRLNDEWLHALEEVRQLEGFQDFLRPRRISTLLGAATKAPLVIFNASDTDCAALILTFTGVQHVPLPDLTFPNLNRLVKMIQIVTAPGSRGGLLPESNRARIEDFVRQMSPLSDTLQPLKKPSEDRHMTKRVPVGCGQPDDVFRVVLGTLWKAGVEPVIRQLGLEKSNIPSSLRWCPTGPFAFLPIHAAGIYETKESVCVSDYVISSYTPTISALLRDMPHHSTPFKMMVVIQPELPYTVDELQRIEARLPVTKAQTGLVKLVSGTVEEVTSHLPTASIAHFACHGTQDAQKPLKSSLLLQDHPLTVHRIMQQSNPNAMLAFLAACQTAMGDKTLPDEVIHLGSTLLFSGFQGVVATMWNISDVDGPGVADAFYEYLFEEFKENTEDTFHPDTTRAARALHLAVAKLRCEKKVSFVRWVPFIHMGR